MDETFDIETTVRAGRSRKLSHVTPVVARRSLYFTDAAAPVVFSVLASLERGLDALKIIRFPESVEAA